MASKSSSPIAIFLVLNVLFFTMTSATYYCPTDTLKIGACLTALNLVKLNVNSPPVAPCCSLVTGLVDAEAALCLCTILNTKLLGISLTVPIDINLLLNNCGYSSLTGYHCP